MGVTNAAFSVVSRLEPRSHNGINATVQVYETPKQAWKQTTKVTAVSRNGAGFSLPRRCAVGRLVAVTMPLSPELRAYDQEREMYVVKGIVQYCNEGEIDGKKVYHVGIGFIGKEMPPSFKADHMQNYRIVGMAKNGLWEITEVKAQFKNRKRPRYGFSIPVVLSLIQKERRSVTKEETFTKNVAAGGVAVISQLDAKVGDKLKFACSALDFYAIAEVRARMGRSTETTTLHLEFIEAQFPIERLFQVQKSLAA